MTWLIKKLVNWYVAAMPVGTYVTLDTFCLLPDRQIVLNALTENLYNKRLKSTYLWATNGPFDQTTLQMADTVLYERIQ